MKFGHVTRMGHDTMRKDFFISGKGEAAWQIRHKYEDNNKIDIIFRVFTAFLVQVAVLASCSTSN